MDKPTIFISCGQYSDTEKRLGKQIAQIVKSLTGFEAFFAEDVQDLNGLDANILGALRDCVGFITVLHPRGDIKRPDGSVITRASVWIEQEIAVATYIQRVEKRELPIIAFKHASVSREGIRDLLQLNPIPFTDESEVLVALTERLPAWRSLKASGIHLSLKSIRNTIHADHVIRKVVVTLANDSGQRIHKYDLEVGMPAALLKHWTANYPNELHRGDPQRRYFRFNEADFTILNPHTTLTLASYDYCTKCAFDDCGGIAAIVAEAVIEAKVWIDGREYSAQKTIQELAEDSEREESRAK
jgi:hypothetical protein